MFKKNRSVYITTIAALVASSFVRNSEYRRVEAPVPTKSSINGLEIKIESMDESEPIWLCPCEELPEIYLPEPDHYDFPEPDSFEFDYLVV